MFFKYVFIKIRSNLHLITVYEDYMTFSLKANVQFSYITFRYAF